MLLRLVLEATAVTVGCRWRWPQFVLVDVEGISVTQMKRRNGPYIKKSFKYSLQTQQFRSNLPGDSLRRPNASLIKWALHIL